MNKKTLTFVVVIAIALAFAYTSCKKAKPPVKLTMISKVVAKGKQPVASFDHEGHKKWAQQKQKNCKFCHNKGKVTQKCSECHKGEKGEKVMHKNCIEQCHQTDKKGPQKDDCQQCHKK